MSKATSLTDFIKNKSKTKSNKDKNYNFRVDPKKKQAFDKWCKENKVAHTDFFTDCIDKILEENKIIVA